jgi:thiazole/oxazole-forming peptide maturase SagD family component
MLSLIDKSVARRLASAQPDASPALIGMIDRVDRLFRVATPDAPGFHLVGSTFTCLPAEGTAADILHLSASGNGEALARALVSCLAEAAEMLSSVERPGDTGSTLAPPPLASGWVGDIIADAARTPDWVTATHAVTAAEVAVPADIVFRRVPARRVVENSGPLSAGVAAGRTPAAAAERAILELVERDALALWWLAGRSPRAAAAAENRLADDLLARMRGADAARATHICDLTTDLGIPVCFAYSHDRNGFGLACGAAARRRADQATQAAILEMLQMEMAGTVATAKQRERGDEALNAADRRHIARIALHVPSCPAFATGAAGEGLATASTEPVAAHLLKAGIDVYLVTQTRSEIGIDVVRAIAPQLQPYARSIATERLKLERGASSGAPGLALEFDPL